LIKALHALAAGGDRIEVREKGIVEVGTKAVHTYGCTS